jgi:hypothetical protein
MPRRRSLAVAIKLKNKFAALIFYKRESGKIAENQAKASALFGKDNDSAVAFC